MEQNNINPVGGGGQIPFINGQNANNQLNGQMQNGLNVNLLNSQNLPQEQQGLQARIETTFASGTFVPDSIGQTLSQDNRYLGLRYLNDNYVSINSKDSSLEIEYKTHFNSIQCEAENLSASISKYFSVKHIEDLLSNEELKNNEAASRLKYNPKVFECLPLFKEGHVFFENFRPYDKGRSYQDIYPELINKVENELTSPLKDVFTDLLSLYSDYLYCLSKRGVNLDFNRTDMDDFELELIDQFQNEFKTFIEGFKKKALIDSGKLKVLCSEIKKKVELFCADEIPDHKFFHIQCINLEFNSILEGLIDPENFTYTALSEVIKKREIIQKNLNRQLEIYNSFKEVENNPDRLKEVLNSSLDPVNEVENIQSLLVKITNHPEPLFTIKQILLVYAITERQHQRYTKGGRVAITERFKGWRIRLLGQLIKNSTGSIEADDRKALIVYLNYLKAYGENSYKNLHLIEFEEKLNKEAGFNGKDRIQFTFKEKTTYLKSLELQSGNISISKYKLKNLERFFPYVVALPKIDFQAGAFADLSEEKILELLGLAQNLTTFTLENYPCQVFPDLPQIEYISIVGAKKLKRFQGLKYIEFLEITNSAIEEIDINGANLKSIVLNDNLNLLSIKLSAPNIEQIKLRNNPEIHKFELSNDLKSLKYLTITDSPNLAPDQFGVVKFDRRFEYGFDHLEVDFIGSKLLMNDPSTKYMFGLKQSKGHFVVETEVLKNNPELVLVELKRYMQIYHLNVAAFPKIAFSEKGKIVSPLDSGGPRRQFMMMLFSALKNTVKEGVIGDMRFEDLGDGVLPVSLRGGGDSDLILRHCSDQELVIARLLHLAFTSDAPIGITFSLRFYEAIKGLYLKKYDFRNRIKNFYYKDMDAFLEYYPLLRKDLKDLCLIAEGKIDLASEELDNKTRDHLLFSLGFFIANDEKVYSESDFDFGFDYETVDINKVLEVYKDNKDEVEYYLFKSLLNQAKREGRTAVLKKSYFYKEVLK